MCGIFGLIRVKGPTPDAKEWARALSALAVVSTERGTDSSGLCRLGEESQHIIMKDATPAWELLQDAAWPLVSAPAPFAIGHTRLATHGKITQSNAHPFTFRTDAAVLTGVHNGVINNHAKLRRGRKVYAVDSANLIAELAQRTPGKAWGKLLRKASGSLALALLRTTPDGKTQITLTRRGNPLWIVRVAELNALAFASTEYILETALTSARLTVLQTPRSIPEGVFLTFDGESQTAQESRWLPLPKTPKPEPMIPSTYVNSMVDKYDHQKGLAPLPKLPEHIIEDFRPCGACLDYFPHGDMRFDKGAWLCEDCWGAAYGWVTKGGAA